MRIAFLDDAERALLAQRLGEADSVSDPDLAAAFADWVDERPASGNVRRAARGGSRRLTAADLEDLNAVTDWSEVEAQPSGYANNMTGWIGQG